MFSCELCEISKTTFLTEHLRWLLLTIYYLFMKTRKNMGVTNVWQQEKLIMKLTKEIGLNFRCTMKNLFWHFRFNWVKMENVIMLKCFKHKVFLFRFLWKSEKKEQNLSFTVQIWKSRRKKGGEKILTSCRSFIVSSWFQTEYKWINSLKFG